MYTQRMAFYTGKGDKGTTKLFDSKSGERVAKNTPIFEALGTVDELNTIIGWCRAGCSVDWLVVDKTVGTILLDVQQHLFTIQAELAGAKKKIPIKNVRELETLIEVIEKELPEVTSFLIPGGSELSSRLDIARAVSRRAERRLVDLSENGKKISEHTLTYANRLSSLLYALVRFINYRSGSEEQSPEYIG